ncbi:PAS domain-containing sensor histidine kinase [Hathewaya histolytica]|uniref:sensor histidine kinase n=1 Tax=Hathewaya histolytica TaxID=1498 RepID=UPI003B679E49
MNAFIEGLSSIIKPVNKSKVILPFTKEKNYKIDLCRVINETFKKIDKEIEKFSIHNEDFEVNQKLLYSIMYIGRFTSFEETISILKIYKKVLNMGVMNSVNLNCYKKLKKINLHNDFFDNLEQIAYKKYYKEFYHLSDFNEITKKASMLIFAYSGDKLKYINSVAEECIGYSLFELQSNGLESICCPSYSKILTRLRLSTNKCSKPVKDEIKIKDKSGNFKWMYISKGDISTGSEDSTIIFAFDITEKKRMQQELVKSEKRYKTVLDLMPDALFICEEEKIVYTNNSGIELLGGDSLEKIKDKSFYEFFNYNRDSKSKVKVRVSDLENKRDNKTIKIKLKRKKDRRNLNLEIKCALIPYKGKKALLSIVRDITESNKIDRLQKKVLEKTLLLKQARELDKIKSEIFSNISHEIRTPLNIIFSANQFMIKLIKEDIEVEQKKDKLREYINMSMQNSYRILRLVNNIIDLSRVELGYMPLELKCYNIVEVVEDITMAVSNYLHDREVNLVFDTNVEEKYMYFDLDKIKRVMLNLLSNAIKFSGSGSEVLVNLNASKNKVVISVKDNGIGIPKNKQKEIFKIFTQVDKSFSRMAEGTGVGLSVVNAFVKMHSGRVYVNSEFGGGSEFVIDIPCSKYSLKEEEKINNLNLVEEKDMLSIEFSDIYNN